MTTAHRATYKPAQGNENQGGYKRWTQSRSVSALHLPAYTKLKKRHDVQVQGETLTKKDKKMYEMDLKEKEKRYFKKHKKEKQLLMLEYEKEKEIEKILESNDEDTNVPIIPIQPTKKIEKIGEENEDDSDDEDEDLDSDSSSDDEEEELLRQLELIKAEREKEKLEKINEQKIQETVDILSSNPLLKQNKNENDTHHNEHSGQQKSYKLKRKWNDYSVFKNQAIGEPERKKRKFVNDTIRNDFHRKFLDDIIK